MTGLRVGPGPVDLFLARLDALAHAVAARASELAQADANRTTLLERDVDEAFLTGLPSSAPIEPAALFAAIDRLETDQLATLINRIRDWLGQRQDQP